MKAQIVVYAVSAHAAKAQVKDVAEECHIQARILDATPKQGHYWAVSISATGQEVATLEEWMQ